MASDSEIENDEEFISLDDDLLEEEHHEEVLDEDDISEDASNSNKLLYILIAIFTIVAFALLGFLLYLYLTKEEKIPQEEKTEQIIENIQNDHNKAIETSSYQNVLKKAQTLYKEGKKEQALSIYESLSKYNKALTYYNIGVAKLKKREYEPAKEAFLHALKNEKLHFESALNIAIAAFEQGDSKTFRKYLRMATIALNDKIDSPLHSYYRALIDYYRGFYPETLVPLRHPSSNFYQDEKNRLLAKLYTAFDNHKKAIKTIESSDHPEDFFTLALLYANQNDFTLSEKYLLKAMEIDKDRLDEHLALALVYNKMGLFKKSSTLLNKVHQTYKEKASKQYPIKVSLNQALFDPKAAQKAFQNTLFFDNKNRYSLLFYFAPYRMMSPKLAITNIDQAAKNIHINAVNPAIDTLQVNSKISDANLEISRGIKAALSGDIYKANRIFKEGIKHYPSSAQLHYNLALTYAKMYDFQNAYQHFKSSSILDTTHYYAPLFAHFCATLLYKEEKKDRLTKIEDALLLQKEDADRENTKALIAIARNDIQYRPQGLDKTPFEDAISMVLAQMRGEYNAYQSSTDKLLAKLPHDLIANILHIDAYHDKQEIQSYAKEIQASLDKPTLQFNALYSGNAFVKELYIQMLSIAGVVPRAKKIVEDHIRKVGTDDIASLQALAYADIYLKEFDQAYAIYNHLIDDLKQKDSNTLFLAAIASIGAKHHANAIALLELAKLTNKSNLESRFALGILYHEAENLEGAAIQYAKIGDIGFQSRYFTFNLDKSHLKEKE